MKKKILIALIGPLFLMISCLAPKPTVIEEGGQTAAQLGGIKFVVPEGFSVVGTEGKHATDKQKEKLVLMAAFDKKFSTVIMFSMQQTIGDYTFDTVDMKEIYPNAVIYNPDPLVKKFDLDKSRKIPYKAASYPSYQPIYKKTDPKQKLVCKSFTGYYHSGTKTRYRIDIYQNYIGEVSVTGKDQFKLTSAQEKELKEFHAFSLNIIKTNLSYL
jgi:hypothetical protein